MIDIKVPTVGESISEVTLLKWNKKDGDYVERDEVIAELESEKATFEVNAEQAGVLKLGVFRKVTPLRLVIYWRVLMKLLGNRKSQLLTTNSQQQNQQVKSCCKVTRRR